MLYWSYYYVYVIGGFIYYGFYHGVYQWIYHFNTMVFKYMKCVSNQCPINPRKSLKNSSVTRASKGQIMDHKGNVNSWHGVQRISTWDKKSPSLPGNISNSKEQVLYLIFERNKKGSEAPAFVLFYFFWSDHSDVVCGSAIETWLHLQSFRWNSKGCTGYLCVVWLFSAS